MIYSAPSASSGLLVHPWPAEEARTGGCVACTAQAWWPPAPKPIAAGDHAWALTILGRPSECLAILAVSDWLRHGQKGQQVAVNFSNQGA